MMDLGNHLEEFYSVKQVLGIIIKLSFKHSGEQNESL
jgi:hypothetical protein